MNIHAAIIEVVWFIWLDIYPGLSDSDSDGFNPKDE